MCKQGAEPLVLSNSWVLCANKLLNLEKNLHVTSLYPEWISPSQFLDSYPWIGIQSRKKKKQKHISNSSHFLEKGLWTVSKLSVRLGFSHNCMYYNLSWGNWEWRFCTNRLKFYKIQFVSKNFKFFSSKTIVVF